MVDPRDRDPAGFLLLEGRGTSPGIACGPLRRNRPGLDPPAVQGAILVAQRATPEDVGRILASSGTLTLGGAVLSHVSLLSREFGKPSVSLGARSRVRMLADDNAGILELADVVGDERVPVLHADDIVLLDGDEGTVRVPGGTDAGARRDVRRMHALLSAYGREPESEEALRKLVDAAVGSDGPAFAYLIEAALPHRSIPAGPATRRLLEALRADVSGRDRLERGLEELRSRVLTRARRRLDRGREDLRVVEAADDLDRAVRALQRRIDGDARLVADLDGDPDRLRELLDPLLDQAKRRREDLRQALRARVSEALRLPEEAFRHRVGGFYRLLRRVRAAKLDERSTTSLQARLRRHVAEERARVGQHLIVSLESTDRHERSLVGGKAAGLLEVRPVLPDGCRVPAGFVVTSAAYRLHLLGETGERLREAVRERDEAAVSRRARAAILSGDVPDEVVRAVDAALSGFGETRLAVRSSATVEDGRAGSLAGQFDTTLGVAGLSEVVQRIRGTWASLWNARALRTLAASDLSPLDAGQAVLVQEVVPTRSAGVLVTRDPSGGPDSLLVNAAWGLGEGISQGEFPGDLYWVRRSTGEPLGAEIGHGTSRIVLDPDGPGTVEVPLDPDQTGRACLSEGDLGRLAALGRALDEATGRAQDVEFGFASDGTLVVFQVRRVVARRNTP